jgi:Tol biopolymer transport system component
MSSLTPTGVIDVFTGQVLAWHKETPLSFLSLFSPDFTRAIYHQYGEDTRRLYDVEHDVMLTALAPSYGPLAWMPDASGFVTAVSSESDGNDYGNSVLGFFNRDRRPIETIASAGSFGEVISSPSGKRLAFTSDRRLYVADSSEKQVVDYCLGEVAYDPFWFNVAWSPDGSTLAFNKDRYPVLLNAETLEMKILLYRVGRIWGWYSLP